MANKLLKRSISLALAFAVVLSLSCCGGDKEIIPPDVGLPDIVFVMFFWDEDPSIIGEYIDKDGNIRSFKFTEEEGYDIGNEIFNDKINKIKRIYQYPEMRSISKVNDLVMQHYKEADDSSIVKTINADDLNSYYNELWQINTNAKMKACGMSVAAVADDLSCIYGIKKLNDSTSEIVFIRELNIKGYLSTKEKHTESLFAKLCDVFTSKALFG